MSGPLPPHERPWRHPSELPAPPHEPPSRSGRLLILGTATVGLLLVGVLALRMTPERSAVTRDTVVGITSTAALVDFTSEPLSAAGTAAGDSIGVDSFDVEISEALDRIAETLIALPSTTLAETIPSAAPPVDAGPEAQLVAGQTPVTPVGSGLGVTTAAALDGRGGPIDAVLPSGSVVPAEVIGFEDGVAVVALDANESEAVEFSEQSATADPPEDLRVEVEGEETIVHGDELAASGASEGAPIYDGTGGLVGLATVGADGTVQMLPLTSVPDVGTATTEPEPSIVETSEPAPTEPTTAPSTSSTTTTPTTPPSSAPPTSTTSTTTTTTTVPTDSTEPTEPSTTLEPSTTSDSVRRPTPGDATV